MHKVTGTPRQVEMYLKSHYEAHSWSLLIVCGLMGPGATSVQSRKGDLFLMCQIRMFLMVRSFCHIQNERPQTCCNAMMSKLKVQTQVLKRVQEFFGQRSVQICHMLGPDPKI